MSPPNHCRRCNPTTPTTPTDQFNSFCFLLAHNQKFYYTNANAQFADPNPLLDINNSVRPPRAKRCTPPRPSVALRMESSEMPSKPPPRRPVRSHPLSLSPPGSAMMRLCDSEKGGQRVLDHLLRGEGGTCQNHFSQKERQKCPSVGNHHLHLQFLFREGTCGASRCHNRVVVMVQTQRGFASNKQTKARRREELHLLMHHWYVCMVSMYVGAPTIQSVLVELGL